jgi:hypothetical protein
MAIAFGDGKVYESHYDVLTDNWIGKDAGEEGSLEPSKSPADNFLDQYRKMKQDIAPSSDEPDGTIVPPIRGGLDEMSSQKRKAFDPEGSDYDMDSAVAAGLQPDETGHWASRDPKTGLILKGKGHPTFELTVKGEEEAGHEIVKKDGRYYSFPKKKSGVSLMNPTPLDQQVPEELDVEPILEHLGLKGTISEDEFSDIARRIRVGEPLLDKGEAIKFPAMKLYNAYVNAQERGEILSEQDMVELAAEYTGMAPAARAVRQIVKNVKGLFHRIVDGDFTMENSVPPGRKPTIYLPPDRV